MTFEFPQRLQRLHKDDIDLTTLLLAPATVSVHKGVRLGCIFGVNGIPETIRDTQLISRAYAVDTWMMGKDMGAWKDPYSSGTQTNVSSLDRHGETNSG